MLPKRERLAFDETDIERIGQAALDHRRADPGQGLELLLGPPRAHCEDRGAGPGAKRGQDRLAIGRLASFDLDVGNHQAQPRGAVEHSVGGILQRRLPERRAAQQNRAVKAAGQQNRDADPQPETADSAEKGAPAPAPRCRLHPSHEAFSTIQATSSSK